ncbi:MAG: hypothetical protein WCG78_05880, partial [Candidatus Omnitrophota bacterium]
RVPLPHLIFLKENTVQPNATMMFRCTLWNLPKEFSTLLRSNSFSDNPGAWNGSLDAEVLRIRFKPEDEKKNRRRQEFI